MVFLPYLCMSERYTEKRCFLNRDRRRFDRVVDKNTKLEKRYKKGKKKRKPHCHPESFCHKQTETRLYV